MRRRLFSKQVLLPDDTGQMNIVPAWIDVLDHKISAVHRSDPGPVQPLGTEAAPIQEDFGDHLITPAFVDAHTHVALSVLRGFDIPRDHHGNLVEEFFFGVEKEMTADDVKAFARMGAYEALLHGTGLIWDHYYHGDAVIGALTEVGLSAVFAPTLQDMHGPACTKVEETLETTLRIASDGNLASQGIYAALGPHATDTVSPELFRRIANIAETHALPVHCHLAQSIDEVARAWQQADTTPVGLLKQSGLFDAAPMSLLVHGVFVSDDDLQMLDSKRTVLGFCPHSQLVFAFVANIQAWDRAGIPWVVGTDCAASNDALNIQSDLRLTASLNTMKTTWSDAHQNFMARGSLDAAKASWEARNQSRSTWPISQDPMTVLDKAWRVAGSLHPAFKAGVIEVGALANLVIWDTTHPTFWPHRNAMRSLLLSETTTAIHNMMVVGKWIGTHGTYAQSLTASGAYRNAWLEANRRLGELEKRLT
jgi:5-methylthioadenosine/S-adenosylhomocysteine deaminase